MIIAGENYFMISPHQYKEMELGHYAKVLVDLHLENPKKFDAKTVLDRLINEYEKRKFEEKN